MAEGDSPAPAAGEGVTSVHLHATDAPDGLDAEWLVEFGDGRYTWRRGHEKARAALRGPLRDLLLASLRRLPLEHGAFAVIGERETLDAWLADARF